VPWVKAGFSAKIAEIKRQPTGLMSPTFACLILTARVITVSSPCRWGRIWLAVMCAHRNQ